MEKKFNVKTNLLDYGEVNSGFAKVKISIMTHEQTANGTHFSKSVINKRRGNLNYLPVIGEFKEEDFGSHGGKIEITDEDIEFIDTTKPYGVVMADSSRWEDVTLKNGETTEYLVADAYLWIDRYPELNALYEGKLNNQSMEINILEGGFNEDTWVYEVEDFEYSALCILGKDILPAFDEARVDVEFAEGGFRSEYQKMMFALSNYLGEEEGEVENMDKKDIEMEEKVEDVEEEDIESIDEEDGGGKEVGEDKTEDSEEAEGEAEEKKSKAEDMPEEEVDSGEDEEEDGDETQEDPGDEEVDYQKKYEELKKEFDLISEDMKALKDFRRRVELEGKMDILNSFKHRYSLSDEDVAEVSDNIDLYSDKEVEDALCVIAFKKGSGVNYSKDEGAPFTSAILSNFGENKSDGTPGVRAILSRRK